MVPEQVRLDIALLNGYFVNHGITSVLLPTRIAQAFTSFVTETSIRTLQVGGENLGDIRPSVGYRLQNCYGPTENTV